MAEDHYPRYRNYEDRPRAGFDRPDREDWTTDDLGYNRGYDRYGPDVGYGDRPYGGRRRTPYNPGYPMGPDPYARRRNRPDRDFWDKAGDEIASWFGDEDAERRRERDQHRGKGPKGYRRSDERINEDVHDRLTDHPYLDASEITASIQNSEVTLDGQVRTRAEKSYAEDCAESVSGVTHVQNNIRVLPMGAREGDHR